MDQAAPNAVADPFYADACAVAEIMQPTEAVFCFSKDRLAERLAVYTAGFPGTVSFAVKSNPSREVVTALLSGGARALGRGLRP